MQERNDTSFHERLAESYLDLFTSAKKQGNSGMFGTSQEGLYYEFIPIIELQRKMYSKLLEFMSESSHYQVDRLFARLPSDGGHLPPSPVLTRLLILVFQICLRLERYYLVNWENTKAHWKSTFIVFRTI